MSPELGDIVTIRQNRFQRFFCIEPKNKIINAIYPEEKVVYISDLKDIRCKNEIKVSFYDLEYDVKSAFQKYKSITKQ